MTVSRHAVIAALFLTTALPASALAQEADDAVDGILACRGVSDTAARLACFDSAAERLAGDRESGELMTVTRSDVAAVEGDSFGFSMPSLPRLRMPRLAIAAADRQHDALEGAANTVDLTEDAPAAVADASAPVPGTAPSAPTPATPAPVTPAPAATATSNATSAEANASSVAILERNEDGDVFRVEMTIERTRTVGYDTLVFYMTNGQVWRQTDSTRVRMPRGEGHTAEIRRGAMTSYLLRINGSGRAIRVERER